MIKPQVEYKGRNIVMSILHCNTVSSSYIDKTGFIGKLHVVEPPVNELAQMHRHWLADLERLKTSFLARSVYCKHMTFTNLALTVYCQRI